MPESAATSMTGALSSFLPVAGLALGNGLGIGTAVISVTVSALVAGSLGWTGALATVPYGIQFLTLLLVTYPSAALMRRLGRKPVFLAAALSGVSGGVAGYLAVLWSDPLLLCVAHGLLGLNLANVNFYRFAALELARPQHRAQAMSLVVFGGTFAALFGPVLSRQAIFSPDVFASAYLGITALCLAIIVLIAVTRLPWPETTPSKFGLSDIRKALRVPQLALGMGFAATGYGAMNLLMIASSLTLDDLGCLYSEISVSIQWHVLAMFAPSLIMGRIIKVFGGLTVAALGGMILIASSAVSMLYPLSIPVIQACLGALGIGWNMTYVGGSYLATTNAPAEHALSIQAVNDVSIGVFAMLGAFLPGAVIALVGWGGANLIVIAVIAPVVLAALIVGRRCPFLTDFRLP